MPERGPTDVLTDDLVRTYRAGARRLEVLVRDALRRGLDPARLGTPGQRVGDATAAYRARQLAAARAITRELERVGAQAGTVAARKAYASALFAVDRLTFDVAGAALESRFGGIHQRQLAVIAGNMSGALEAAARHTGDSIEAVFARANELEAGIPPGAGDFIGRRVDDPWRRVALDTVGEGLVTLDTRRQMTAAMHERLIREGVADALTGFVDASGRRWPLDTYAEMVSRTTTREAASRATVTRLEEVGLDLVTISSHPHKADECTPYDGQTFSLSGDHPDYDELEELPPFHPNCAHVVTPASVNLDELERELEQAAAEGIDVEDVERGPELEGDVGKPGTVGDGSPLSPRAQPSTSTATPARAEAADRVDSWAADPGPELGADVAREAWQDATAAQAAKYERARERADDAVIDEALGPDLVAILDELAASGWKEAADRDLRIALRDGDVTIDEIEDLAATELQRRYDARSERKRAADERGLRRKPFPCFVCGRFKRRPADVCDTCGDDPVSHHGDAHEFNRAYGYAD